MLDTVALFHRQWSRSLNEGTNLGGGSLNYSYSWLCPIKIGVAFKKIYMLEALRLYFRLFYYVITGKST